ncbi:MAG: histidinol-phosphate transaminase [Trueperaceae bacterium]|nr:histidinol-phosphate transaminase [Trueperaceae bacterium]
MALRPQLDLVPAYHFTEQSCTIKLDQNESPFELPDHLQEALFERLKGVALNRYPELNAHSLRKHLAEYLNWSPDGMVISGGSNILIQALVVAAGLGQQVLTVKPSFSVYSLEANILGTDLVEIPLEEDFSLPKNQLIERLKRGKGVFFLANPAAPTANLFEKADIIELAEAAKDNWLMVIDEAYHQFSKTDYSFLIKDYPHIVCLRTFSKAFGLGGVRLGYALMADKVAEQVQKTVLPFSISGLQLAIGEFMLEHQDLIRQNLELILQERERLYQNLGQIKKIKAYPSQANFFLLRVPDAASLYKGMLEHSICIRRQDHLPLLEGCVRVSVGKPEENDAFLSALSKLLG